MAAHRYWGLLVYARTVASTLYTTLAEVEFRGSSGGADLCSGGTASADSYDGAFVPARAFDDSAATFWLRTANTTVRLWYDFGSPVDVVEAWLKLPDVGSSYPGSTHGPAGVQVVWSDNATSWTPVATYEIVSPTDAGEYTITLEAITPRVVLSVPVRLGDLWPSGPLGARVVDIPLRYDSVDGGTYRVAGTVAIDGAPAVPVSRRVRLFHRLTGRLVREMWSAPDGTFEFVNVALDEYIVLSDDYQRLYNAVVADAVMAVP